MMAKQQQEQEFGDEVYYTQWFIWKIYNSIWKITIQNTCFYVFMMKEIS